MYRFRGHTVEFAKLILNFGNSGVDAIVIGNIQPQGMEWRVMTHILQLNNRIFGVLLLARGDDDGVVVGALSKALDYAEPDATIASCDEDCFRRHCECIENVFEKIR